MNNEQEKMGAGVKMEYVLDEYKRENASLADEVKLTKAYIRMLEERIKELTEAAPTSKK